MNNLVRIGTRGSDLALAQVQLVENGLRTKEPILEVKRIIVKTRGDIIYDRRISEIGEKGVFTKELEASLLNMETDIAVHSLKDMPAVTSEGLSVPGVLQREDPRDVLVSRGGDTLSGLPSGAIIGTSSLRRRAVVKSLRPDCSVKEIRGNVDTRLKKLEEGRYDAIILAAAGLIRSGFKNRIVEYLNPEIFVPSGCQGIIGMEVRSHDVQNVRRVQGISHEETFIAAEGERSFMRRIGGGCSTPMGCFARITEGTIYIIGMVADLEGVRIIKKKAEGPVEHAIELADVLAAEIIKAGGKEILDEITGKR